MLEGIKKYFDGLKGDGAKETEEKKEEVSKDDTKNDNEVSPALRNMSLPIGGRGMCEWVVCIMQVLKCGV